MGRQHPIPLAPASWSVSAIPARPPPARLLPLHRPLQPRRPHRTLFQRAPKIRHPTVRALHSGAPHTKSRSSPKARLPTCDMRILGRSRSGWRVRVRHTKHVPRKIGEHRGPRAYKRSSTTRAACFRARSLACLPHLIPHRRSAMSSLKSTTGELLFWLYCTAANRESTQIAGNEKRVVVLATGHG